MGKKTIAVVAFFVLFSALVIAGTVSRGFSSTNIQLGNDLTVTLTVDVSDEDYYLIDETLPINWTIKNDGGGITDQAGHLKWYHIKGVDGAVAPTDTVYNYILTANVIGTHIFNGVFMFENMPSSGNIQGQTTVTVESCALDSDCGTGELCCDQQCKETECTTHGDCGTGHVCSNGGSCEAQCQIGCLNDNQCLPLQICYDQSCVNVQCLYDSDCDDQDARTIDTCENAGAVNAYCENAEVECFDSSECNDYDSSTKDICINPGEENSACTNTTITECINNDQYCPTQCNSTNDNDCSITCGNGIKETNENCETCPQDAACTTGTTCCTQECVTPTCTQNTQCPTGQICTNKGTCIATCETGCETTTDCPTQQICHEGDCLTPICRQNSDCGLGNLCTNPGTAEAQCTAGCIEDRGCPGNQKCCGGQCKQANCETDSDCDDGSASTTDSCTNQGQCNAACTNTTITECINNDQYCPTQCNSTNDNDCSITCGNGIKETNENCETCPQDAACTTGTTCCTQECVTPTCTQNTQCPTGQICTNKGTCIATCETGCETTTDCPTQQICHEGDCLTPICLTNAECDDFNASTTDSCTNPGKYDAACTNTTITECINNDQYCPTQCNSTNDNDCGDNCGNGVGDDGESCSSCPADVTCESGTLCCETDCMTPSCTENSQCEDNDDCTIDSCDAKGTCQASCLNVPIQNCGTLSPPGGGGGLGGGGGGGGGSGTARLTVQITGSCLGQPMSIEVLNDKGNPAKDAQIQIVKDRKTVAKKVTGETGLITFVPEELGEFLFYTTKNMYKADSRRIEIKECAKLKINFEEELETGKEQVITLQASDGNFIRDFNILLIFPDNTKKLIHTNDGTISIPIMKSGKYSAQIITPLFEHTIRFEAKEPMQIVPNINPDAEPVIRAILGEETVESPNYLIIWILAVAVISGLIIQVTKLKPGWFRIFMALTYTTLPIVVNHYTRNFLIAFAIIGIQTVILTALWFRNWKRLRKEPAIQTEGNQEEPPAAI